MVLGDDKRVAGIHGADVEEGHRLPVLVDFVRRQFTAHYFAKDAIRHRQEKYKVSGMRYNAMHGGLGTRAVIAREARRRIRG